MQQHSLKKCIIIYGFVDIDQLTQFKTSVILIEPRKSMLDFLSLKRDLTGPKDIILVPKMLHTENTMKERILYHKENQWFSASPDITSEGVSKEKVYSTSLTNIIRQYKIQNIEQFIVNINIDNIDSVLDNAKRFNHIISRVHLSVAISSSQNESSTVLHKFFNQQPPSESVVYTSFSHKNLNIQLPNIYMYLVDTVPESVKEEFDLLVAQYNITIIQPQINTSKRKPFIFDFITSILDPFFATGQFNECDILIQFNPKYLLQNNVFHILYPLKQTEMYISQKYDIIYTTKGCMHMMYQIIKSKYFTNYMEDLQQQKRTVFKLFAKRYFYEYIQRVFDIKEYNDALNSIHQ